MLNASFLTLLVIFAWAACCMGAKCWWQDISELKSDEDAHYIRKDTDQSKQLLCPKTSGHDVVLCQQRVWRGECFAAHIPRGQNCTNVDVEINDMASSVNTLGGCYRLYNEADCQGRWRVFDKTVGIISLFEMDNAVSSVGLCTTEDQQGCNRATFEGRRQCLLLKDLSSRTEISYPSFTYEYKKPSYIIVPTGLIAFVICFILRRVCRLCCCISESDESISGPKYRPLESGPRVIKNSSYSSLPENAMPGVFVVDETGKVYKKDLI